MADALSLDMRRLGLRMGSELSGRDGAAGEALEYAGLRGRLALLCGGARLSAATRLLLEAQAADEACAWVVRRGFEPYLPDWRDAGVALESVVVVRLEQGQQAARAAELLLRGGGLGLVVLDVDDAPPRAALRRLAQHAERQDCVAALLCERSELDSAVSVAVRADLDEGGRERLHIEALRDRRQPGGWQVEERVDAVPGCP